MEPENPTISLPELVELERKIKGNNATQKDYERLEFYLSSAGVEKDFLLNVLKEKNIFSFEEFITERNKPIGRKNQAVDGMLLGYIIGTIGALKEYVSLNNLK